MAAVVECWEAGARLVGDLDGRNPLALRAIALLGEVAEAPIPLRQLQLISDLFDSLADLRK